MTEPLRSRLERALGIGLSALAALIAVTCGSTGTLVQAPDAPRAVSAAGATSAPRVARTDPSPAPKSEPVPKGTSSAPAPPLAQAGSPTHRELAHLFDDLGALEEQRRQQSVRVLWLGDSHTAADYLTGAVRARLQTRFGAGGPGFVRVGLKMYRHSQVRSTCDGPWKLEPVPAPRRTPFDDGVFALGGLRVAPDSAPAVASFEVNAGAAQGPLHWQLWFSLKEGASFRVTVARASQVVTAASSTTELPGAGVASLSLESGPTDKLELLTRSGAPRFYGLIVEGSKPGLVLDTVGIDGARLATTLAWGEASFEAAVRARAPSLVVFAFGTNEAFDADKLDKYRAQYQALLTRVRLAASDTDCLIVGPPDAVAVAGGSEPRVASLDELQRSIAAELGCAYVSQFEIMGGSGGYGRWAQKSPPLARGDRLHLTIKGYEIVGNTIADHLLDAYQTRPRQD
jgi:lysophospholipase L1-like esterase